MAFNKHEYARKYGKNKTPLTCEDGTVVTIPGMPKKYTPAQLEALAVAAKEIKVSFPKIELGAGKSVSPKSVLTGERAGGFVAGCCEDVEGAKGEEAVEEEKVAA